MQNNDFDTLIEKYLNNELNAEERENVELWLRHLSDPSASEQLREAEQKERGEAMLLALQKRINEPEPEMLSRFRKLRPVLKMAATFFLCCSLILFFRTRLLEAFNINQYASVTNSGGRITKAILSDGSIVWLKGNSELIYPLKFKGALRTVDLKGEALFEISKDPAHPFEISCGGLKTRVLGTSFNIRHASDKVEVNVLTGKVYLSSGKAAPVMLHPRQKAVFLEHGNTIVKQPEPVMEVAALTKGTEYMMQFNDARLAEVLQRIENKFEVEITFKDKKVSNNRITADFTDQSLLSTISMMSDVFNMDFRIDGQSVTIEDKT